MKMPKSTVHRRYREALARLPAFRDIEAHRADVYADIELVLETLRPLVHDDEREPTKDDVAGFVRALDAKVRLLGLDAPRESLVMHESVGQREENPYAREYLMKVAAWARATRAINVEGYQPPLPPGITERVGVSGLGRVDRVAT